MIPNPYLKQYQQTQVQTASPEKILIMLYDGCIQFLNKAKVGLEEKNIQETHNNLIGAQKIIAEFMNTLDIKKGGELAVNLFNLYEYLHFCLVEANMKKDIALVDEVLMHIKELRETWNEAIKLAHRERNGIAAPEAVTAGETIKTA